MCRRNDWTERSNCSPSAAKVRTPLYYNAVLDSMSILYVVERSKCDKKGVKERRDGDKKERKRGKRETEGKE